MKKWYIKNSKENLEKLKNNSSLSTIQKIILANRDIIEEDRIEKLFNSDLKNLCSPFNLMDMEKGVNIVLETILEYENICIVGDYDQDGVAATTILYKGIGYFYENISYFIPDRVEEGYGLNNTIVDRCKNNNISLIITCDNGIAAHEAIDYANKKGIKVIVTDHHEPVKKNGRDDLPPAAAVINPWREDDKSSFKKICGAFVAYKLIWAIYIAMDLNVGEGKKFLENLIQYAALGTVADMMEVIDENRIVVVEGLKKLNNTDNKGLLILLEELNIGRQIDIYTIGFIIGPIVNSSGRIYTARLAVELFLENDDKIVREYARELIKLNNMRKDMTKDGFEISIKKINDEKLYLNDIIALYNKDVHESICGLVAGRIKDIYHRPTIVLTESERSGEVFLKGSGRSISAYNMYEKLSKHRDMYLAFGGHKMACGLSMDKKYLQDFIQVINSESGLTEDDLLGTVEFDYPLKFSQINLALISDIKKLEPFGYGFSRPKFASKNITIEDIDIIGKNKNVVRFKLRENDIIIQAISFNVSQIFNDLTFKYELDNFEDLLKLRFKTIDLVYKLGINEYKGYKNIQLEIETVR